MTEIPAAPAPPATAPHPPPPAAGAPLASRWERLFGAIIDSLVTGIPAGAAGYALGLYDGALEGQPIPFPDQLAITVLGIVAFVAIHGSLIYGRGQTVGKWLLGMVVVGLDDDEPVDGNRYVLLRVLPVTIAGVVPFVGPIVTLVDPLFIFGRERRCLHDYIAGTRVIKP